LKTRLTTLGKLSSAQLRVLLFLVLWFAYGAAINSSNLLDFDLQQIGVEAIVERGHFYLEQSIPLHLQSKGDVFNYQGHNYAAKQPGQFMAGAIVYSLLHKLGLSYVDHYLLTAALVTFFTTSLVLAASGVVLFDIASEFTADGRSALHPARTARVESPLFWPLAATLSYALATTAFAYSGIAHHDALATGYLVIAFYCIFQLSRRGGTMRSRYLNTALAGLLLGWTITTSMLPFFMVVVCLFYFLSLRRWRLLPVFLVAIVAGVLPLFIYDAVSFSNPFLLPNVAGASMFSDTFFYFDPRNLGDKLVLYAKSLTAYVPVFAVGLFGLSYYPRRIRRGAEFLTLLALMIALAVFVLNIKSDGDCQFGPRYLLPAMPFACLGIAGYSYLSTSSERRLAGMAVILAGAVSFIVNLVGATGSAMNCPHGQNAFWNHVAAIQHGEGGSYPLAASLFLPLLVCITLSLLNLRARRKTES
jgi:hypothetical protein